MSENHAHSWHAPAARAAPAALDREAGLIANNPVTDTLLASVDGLLAVLNAQRQILAVNETFLESLDVGNASDMFSLRVGEALSCVHACEEPGGCGTSRACPSCGVVNAVLETLQTGEPAREEAVVSVDRSGERRELSFDIRAYPLGAGGGDCVLLFLRDTTDLRRLEGLERACRHEVNDLLQGLRSSSDLLVAETDTSEMRVLGRHVRDVVEYLARELEFQRLLVENDLKSFRRVSDHVPVARIQTELRRFFRFHPAANDRHLDVDDTDSHTWIRTDTWILLRILTNLVLNALEASPEGARVEVRTMATDEHVVFHVWNRGAVDPLIRPRIFERGFSTKAKRGRGQGTFAARYLAEKLLRGEVGFTSSEKAGTEFRVSVPR